MLKMDKTQAVLEGQHLGSGMVTNLGQFREHIVERWSNSAEFTGRFPQHGMNDLFLSWTPTDIPLSTLTHSRMEQSVAVQPARHSQWPSRWSHVELLTQLAHTSAHCLP